MGCYVNPQTETKEAWLSRHGTVLLIMPEWEAVPSNQLPVCLVDNGPFTAAAVAFSQSEYKYFMKPDSRPKVWYLAKIDDLKTVSELECWLAYDGQ